MKEDRGLIPQRRKEMMMRIIIWGHKAPSCLRHDRQVRGQGKEALIYALIKAYRHIYTLRV